MAHVVTDVESAASPERVLAALTDFRRGGSSCGRTFNRTYFKVGSVGAQSADVTEGSPVFGGVWERGRYDWSHPGIVRIDVEDSNAFKPGSFWV